MTYADDLEDRDAERGDVAYLLDETPGWPTLAAAVRYQPRRHYRSHETCVSHGDYPTPFERDAGNCPQCADLPTHSNPLPPLRTP